LGKLAARSCLKNIIKTDVLGVWLRWYNACLMCTTLRSILSTGGKQKRENEKRRVRKEKAERSDHVSEGDEGGDFHGRENLAGFLGTEASGAMTVDMFLHGGLGGSQCLAGLWGHLNSQVYFDSFHTAHFTHLCHLSAEGMW
jgi:hypothetical protein